MHSIYSEISAPSISEFEEAAMLNIFDFHGITGMEETLASCSHYGWENHDCYHGEDVGIKCTNETILGIVLESLVCLYPFAIIVKVQVNPIN